MAGGTLNGRETGDDDEKLLRVNDGSEICLGKKYAIVINFGDGSYVVVGLKTYVCVCVLDVEMDG